MYMYMYIYMYIYIYIYINIHMITNDEDDPGSRPCDRECSYCHLLRETEGKDFKSVTTGCKYKVRQKITCEAKDVIYLVTCKGIISKE